MGIVQSCTSTPESKEENKDPVPREVIDQEYNMLFQNNKKWVEQVNKNQPGLFVTLSAQQKPKVLYLGCSDSRVPPSKFLDLVPGEIFEHRNIANVIISTDMNSQSVINYAVEHLHVQHIIVCGHYCCGGIAAAFSGHNHDFMNNWLVHLNDVYDLHKDEIDKHPDKSEKLKKFVEFNAIENAINVMKNISVQKHYSQYGYPTVHATVYNIENGLLKDLNVDLRKKMKEFGNIYGHSLNAYNELCREKTVDF